MDWKITLSDLCYDEAERRAVDDVIASKWLTMGPRVAEFEQALSARLGGAHVIVTCNCTAALHLALMALGVGPGDEVIAPSLTFVATTNVARMLGATVRFADIVSVEEPTIDPAQVAALVGGRTRAIMPVHYAGFACRMEALNEAAARDGRRIPIVEDAAHALGATGADGRPLGAVGDIGALSFFSNKNLATGEGGAAVMRDPALADKIRRMRSHGMSATTWTRHKGGGSGYDVVEVGLNYRPSELTAALGLAQLAKFNSMQERRKQLYGAYLERLKDARDVAVPFAKRPPAGEPAYHIFPILLPDETTRDRVADALRDAGIQTSHHYRPIHQMTAYAGASGPLPKTEEFAARELTLPFHPRMSDADVEQVVSRIRRAL